MEAEEKPMRRRNRQQLSNAMEHMRFAVTYDPKSTISASTDQPLVDTLTLSEQDAYGVPASLQPVRNPRERREDSSNHLKRTDPFQFGSRYLQEGDDIFAFNAWDHVETDGAYAEFAELQYARQREAPVSDFNRNRFNADPAKWWNQFYGSNSANFFKNRKWLQQEFPILKEVTKAGAGKQVLLEVGAGAGNTAFPILRENENEELRVHACDFSQKAVEVMRKSEHYNEKIMRADVWDVAGTGGNALPPGLEPGSVDVVLMIFIFSALAPDQWAQAVRNILSVLKPGGQVLFRDYGRGDLSQIRFKRERWMQENFYVRGDGTRVYFFDKDELEQIWTGGLSRPSIDLPKDTATQTEKEGCPKADATADNLRADGGPSFDVENIGVDRRMLVNRQRRLKMYRVWLQAVFRRPIQEQNSTEA
ncbi:MAG: hypothetical protein M1822_003175 [Bathelium mastoideum]|nr:MAG: hypothetical protein M1822_003175 [Bathelium mastoideum]